jgi:hypothetical protein
VARDPRPRALHRPGRSHALSGRPGAEFNCAFNYGPDLAITFSAQFDSIVATPISATQAIIQTNFKTTGGTDFVANDTTDLASSPVLKRIIQAGVYHLILENPDGQATTLPAAVTVP